MSYDLVIQAEAVVELQLTFDWYELQKAGLGDTFLKEIDTALTRLCRHPLNYSAINERFRKIKVSRFPYIILFEVIGNKTMVRSIKHIKKNTKYN